VHNFHSKFGKYRAKIGVYVKETAISGLADSIPFIQARFIHHPTKSA
jgi:hypothetical protein